MLHIAKILSALFKKYYHTSKEMLMSDDRKKKYIELKGENFITGNVNEKALYFNHNLQII